MSVTPDRPSVEKNAGSAATITDERAALATRYREIGISAVAAALRYADGNNRPADAPAPAVDPRFVDAA